MQEPIEGRCAAIILVVLPVTLYVVVHLDTPLQWSHYWSAALLAYSPPLFLSILKAGIQP